MLLLPIAETKTLLTFSLLTIHDKINASEMYYNSDILQLLYLKSYVCVCIVYVYMKNKHLLSTCSAGAFLVYIDMYIYVELLSDYSEHYVGVSLSFT